MNASNDSKHCYCKPGDEFCGKCDICGKPGHTRHFPAPVALTGAWCDLHYHALANEFGSVLNDIPDTFYEVIQEAEGAKVYAACRGEWAVCFVVIDDGERQVQQRSETLDWPDMWGIWFTPVAFWNRELRTISQAEFESVSS